MKLGCLAVATLVLAACGEPATGTGAARKKWVLKMDVTDFHYLVWRGTIADGETVWLDADGREQARAKGLIVALRDRLWRIELRNEPYQVSGCNADGTPDRYATADMTRVELVSGDETYQMSEWYLDSYAITDGTSVATVTGQLGRFVFITEREELTSCDGRRSLSMKGHAFDLMREDMYTELIDVETETTQRRAATKQLGAEIRKLGGDPGSDYDAYVGDTRLSWKDGAPVLEHLFYLPCAGCSDGDWSTDTVSTWLPATALPGAIDSEAELPPAIRKALSQGDGPVGVTWALPNEKWQRVFKPATIAK